MQIPLYQVDAFTSEVFRGNPAAVCPLPRWLADGTMQAIAAENNLSETAFLVRQGEDYAIRWFTPTVEIDLAGHPTLASAFVLFEYLEPGRRSVTFSSASGPLTVERQGEVLAMDFPARPPRPISASSEVSAALGRAPLELAEARDYLATFASEDDVRALAPDFARVKALGRMIIVTAPGREADFVSRFFASSHGIDEDPVTGSAHCTLIPYWSRRLGKKTLRALQVSRRGGEIFCEDQGGRVRIGGHVARYLVGRIEIPAGA